MATGTQKMEAGEFSLIITGADKAKLDGAVREFAAAFSLDETIAGQIVKSAPIIFAQKLTKSEVKAVTPKLTELSGHGLEFRVTARVAQKLPKVNWPSRPQFTAAGSGSAVGLAFEWDNNAFVCANCGETYVFKRAGQLKLVDAPAASAPAPAPAAAAAPAPRPAPRPAPAPVEEVSLADDAQPIEEAAPIENIDLPDAVEEINLSDSDIASPAESPATPLDLEESASGVNGGSGNIQPPDETAQGDEFDTEAAPAEAPVEEPAAVATGELYNVFLSKITETSKRDKAAELIAKVKKCSTSEAKELTTRLVIPLAKNVPKEHAEDILNQFKKLKIFGRMTKVK